MNGSYDYYRVFYYVAKYKSFTQAAAPLLSNQPNITRTIKNLEADLGCTLFVRSNKGVTLTPEGEKLYAHVSVAFEHIDAAERELSLDKSLQQGLVSIGASEVALHGLLLPVLKAFRSRYPGIRLKVSNHTTPQAISALKDGLIDLAVVTTPLELYKNMKQEELKTIREVAVCAAALPIPEKESVSLSALSGYPIICLGRQTSTFYFYSSWFARYGLTLTPDIEVATADQILPMVKNGLGIGFVPEMFLHSRSSREGVRKLNLQEQIPPRNICLIRRTDHALSIASRELEEMLLRSK